MSFIKLGQKGIAHFVIPLIVIVALGIGGAAYEVVTHADTPSSSTKCINSLDYLGYSGNRSACVIALKYEMNGLSQYFTKLDSVSPPSSILPIDGTFTGATRLQVFHWQNIFGGGSDGQVGHQTWSNLCNQSYTMSNDWNNSNSGKTPPSYMVDEVNAANNTGCNPAVRKLS